MIRLAGFFRELGHGDGHSDEPSIHDRMAMHLRTEKARIVEYLHAGQAFAIAAGFSDDYFQRPHRHSIDSLALLTDGVWAWPSDFAYYVEHYDVAIPSEFVAHMVTRLWKPPTLTQDELMQISAYFRLRL